MTASSDALLREVRADWIKAGWQGVVWGIVASGAAGLILPALVLLARWIG